MKLILKIAGRFFKSKKSRVINTIAVVSWLSIGVAVASMIIILSVMNGMNHFIIDRYSGFDPDIKITPIKGKYAEMDLDYRLRSIEGVEEISHTLEGEAMFKSGDDGQIVMLKGVDSNFAKVNNILDAVLEGEFLPKDDSFEAISLGLGVFARNRVYINSPSHPCNLYTIDAKLISTSAIWQRAIQSSTVYPTSVFSILPEYDNKYILCSIDFARKIWNQSGKSSSVEIKLKDDLSYIKKKEVEYRIRRTIGENNYDIKNRFEQKNTLYHSMQGEKLMMILMFSFVILISTFTMLSTVMLLMYEKRRDIRILAALGMKIQNIKKAFFTYGVYIGLCGQALGLFIGIVVVWCQDVFGLVKFGMGASGSFVLEKYPVDLRFWDVAVVSLISLAMAAAASWAAVANIKRYTKFTNLETV